MEAIAAIAAVALIVWALVYALHGSLIHGLLAFLVTELCFGREFFGFDVGPFFLTLDRVLLLGLAMVYVVRRRWGLTDPKPAARLDWAMLLLAIVLVFSMFSHAWESDAARKVGIWQLVAGFLTPMAVYSIARQSPIDERALVTTYAVLALVGVYLAVTALAEITRQWWLVYPSYIADPTVGIHFGRRGDRCSARIPWDCSSTSVYCAFGCCGAAWGGWGRWSSSFAARCSWPAFLSRTRVAFGSARDSAS